MIWSYYPVYHIASEMYALYNLIHWFETFNSEIIQFKEVQECHLMSGGDTDYLLKLLVKDMDEYNHFVMKRLSKIKIVANTSSNFVMESIVNVNNVPID